MHTHEHTTVWGASLRLGRTHQSRSWYQQLWDWWTIHNAARQQATNEALHRCWDARREATIPQYAEATPEMAAAHHAMSVAAILYGLSQ